MIVAGFQLKRETITVSYTGGGIYGQEMIARADFLSKKLDVLTVSCGDIAI